jgi:hypothetical protein
VNQQHSHAYLFANGRQQCKIVVKYVLADAKGNPVKPTPGSVELLLVDGSNSYLRPGPWPISATRNEYTWDESMFPKALATPSDEDAGSSADDARRDHLWGTEMEITQTFYTATSVVDPTTVGARISMIGGQYSANTLSESVKDDNGGEGDRAGKFYSTVTVHPTVQKALALEAYGDVKTNSNVLNDYLLSGKPAKGRRAYEQVLWVKYAPPVGEVEIKQVRTQSGATAFALWADRGESSNGTEWSFTYCVQPGSNTPQVGKLGPQMLVRSGQSSQRWTIAGLLASHVEEVKRGGRSRVVIGQVMGDDHLQFFEWDTFGALGRMEDHREEFIILTDEFGNDHKLRLYIESGNSLNYVSLAKP